jgi:hypothetical protein
MRKTREEGETAKHRVQECEKQRHLIVRKQKTKPKSSIGNIQNTLTSSSNVAKNKGIWRGKSAKKEEAGCNMRKTGEPHSKIAKHRDIW